ILSQNAIGLLTFGGLERRHQVGRTIPPHFRDAVVGGFGASRLLGSCIQLWIVQRMTLHVTLRTQRLSVLPYQWPVVLKPVFPKGVRSDVWTAPHAVDKLEHASVVPEWRVKSQSH